MHPAEYSDKQEGREMNISSFQGEDFKVVVQSKSWKIGFLRYSQRFAEFSTLERHLQTEESFVLLEGSATLYENQDPYPMEKCKVYTIEKNVWHHIVVSRDATVLVVENTETSLQNTERIQLVGE